MELNLKGKTVFVSGSSRGIGLSIAEMMAAEGCVVYMNGRDEKILQTAADTVRRKTANADVRTICCDIIGTESAAAALQLITADTGRAPHIVVASVGSGRGVTGWNVDDVEWERMLLVNFLGAVRLTRESVRLMKEHGGGSVVCIASIAGCHALAAPVPYSAAKAALLVFVKNTADAVASFGIRVNAVSPGNVYFEGGTWDAKIKEDKEEVMRYINSAVPMQSFVEPVDVAHMTAFLSSDCARHITGANVIVDGGQTRKYL